VIVDRLLVSTGFDTDTHGAETSCTRSGQVGPNSADETLTGTPNTVVECKRR
jgi:hypothetical protein